MRSNSTRLVPALTALLLVLAVPPAFAYNILAMDMGAYWNNLADQYIGAQQGYGTPGAAGERWYTMVTASQLASVNLKNYDVLLVQSGFTDDWVNDEATAALAALDAKSSDIGNFVRTGGGLISWAQPFPAGGTYNWAWAPVGLESHGVFHQNPVEVVDPSHPLMTHSTSASLSDWHASWHGYFDSWDPRMEVVDETGDLGSGDPLSHRALTLAGSLGPGSGHMVFSMQDADYHSYQGVNGARTLAEDALDYAAVSQPVPEPATGWLLAIGLLAVTLVVRRRNLGKKALRTRARN